ncbi:hypothetical protein CLTEP_00690 [Clostridium tepidiprofundi DSM 19306]|uniref:Uncharacterized protein n=1 Tax=Clostridium tepidiprofundi DSM 19306 TaxID=1121338 RepID=A0A151B6Z6_9CLOT|nr:hypothetical protein [Clostridium tepidiprofundi]KYH35676.1 hypothetical protein CLTEP_00690 [Clostridium tepidiprofundi DSM 19306]
MLELKNKKGYSIIEVVFSIAIFIIFSTTVLLISFNSLKLKAHNKEIERYIDFAEGIENILIYNYSYDDVIDIKNLNKCYIKNEDINIEILKLNNLEDILMRNKPDEKPYAVLSIEESKPLNITLSIHTKIDVDDIVLQFYKGKYYEY